MKKANSQPVTASMVFDTHKLSEQSKAKKKPTKRTQIPIEVFLDHATADHKPSICGRNLYNALKVYAENKGKKLTYDFVYKLKDDEICSIKGVGSYGAEVISHLRRLAKYMPM